MSRILGSAIHQAYVYPDFDAALKRFQAGGIGPFFVMESTGNAGIYRGEEHPLSMSVAFFYTGDSCIELISPHGQQQSAYGEFLKRNPLGGLLVRCDARGGGPLGWKQPDPRCKAASCCRHGRQCGLSA